jgi:head-tail adaptor
MISAVDLARMQTMLGDSLPETATIERRGLTPDGTGGYTEVYVADAATVAARVVRGEDATSEQHARLREGATHVIILPFDVEIAPADRVRIGARVFGVITGSAEHTWAVAQQVQVREEG